MHFPVSDVVANVKAFLKSVYAATVVEKDPAALRLRPTKSAAQNRMSLSFSLLVLVCRLASAMASTPLALESHMLIGSASILRCLLSSRQGPGIELIQ